MLSRAGRVLTTGDGLPAIYVSGDNASVDVVEREFAQAGLSARLRPVLPGQRIELA